MTVLDIITISSATTLTVYSACVLKLLCSHYHTHFFCQGYTNLKGQHLIEFLQGKYLPSGCARQLIDYLILSKVGHY